jgi:hypothetical protein
MTTLSNAAWVGYEQIAVLISLPLSVTIVGFAFKPIRMKLNTPFDVSLTWDFSRSWASNISALAGIIGVSVANSITTDFKPFTQVAAKNSYNVSAVLMAAVVIAAPSAYTMLQIRKDNQLVGCAGGFLVASTLTIWGTIAQLLLQIALLIAFVVEKPNDRFGLALVPVILLLGLAALIPYSIRSVRVALAAETEALPALLPRAAKEIIGDRLGAIRANDESQIADVLAIPPALVRKVALL